MTEGLVTGGRIDMRPGKPHAMRNAILVVLFLIGGGTLVRMYMHEGLLRDRNLVVAGHGVYGVSQRSVKVPLFSSLPIRFLSREAVSISLESNAGVLKSVFEVFDPSLRSFLASVPIVLDASADTARAYPEKGYIGVSPDWDNVVVQSKYRAIYEQGGMKPEDPVFGYRFKTILLIHEFLHILQVYQGIDVHLCYEAVARWYTDPRYGIPSPKGMGYADTARKGRGDTLAINRVKYILWHELYNYRKLSEAPRDESWKNMRYGERYRSTEKGVEEFAYIGQEILSGGSGSKSYIKTGQWCDRDWKNKKMRVSEVSPEVISVFRGVFNPALTQ